mmetsp:Transcript_88532/g.280153  ORF Transcript_88532/g.280153 Transcript_88532/m.280153 type:complete len:444 (+) Transcript_88532:69-1400(+)
MRHPMRAKGRPSKDAAVGIVGIVVELADLLAKVFSEERVAKVGLLVELQPDELLGSRLLGGVPDLGEQPAGQRGVHGDALPRRERQHGGDELQGGRRRVRQPCADAPALAPRAGADVLLRVLALQPRDLLLRRSPQDVEDHVQLVGAAPGVKTRVVAVPPVRREGEAGRAREERAPVLQMRALEHLQELAVDAAHRPDVYLLIVVVLQQDQLRCAVPARDHVSRHRPLRAARGRHDWPVHLALLALLARRVGQRGLPLRVHGPREAEVADLHGAVLVHQAVGRLQVPVVDAGRVQVLQAQQEVVEQSCHVGRGQGHVGVDELVHVGISQLHDDEHLLEAAHVRDRRDVVQPHDAGVVELCHNGDLAQDPLAVRWVAEEAAHPLDSHEPAGLLVDRLPHTAVGSAANRLLGPVPLREALLGVVEHCRLLTPHASLDRQLRAQGQ